MSRVATTGTAIALAAAAAGVVIPSLRTLAHAHGAGAATTGVLVAAHVVGGALGAATAPSLARRVGVRPLAMGALLASAFLLAVVSAVPSLAALLVARFLDGACHLLGVTTLFAAGISGSRERRARQSGVLGMILVLAVGAGLGVGGRLAPSTAFAAAAGLTVLSMLVATPALREVAAPACRPLVRLAHVVAPPALIAGGERFVFGLLTVSIPIALGPRRAGMVLGVFMTASVVALPLARRLALTWGPRVLAARAATGLFLFLAAAALGLLDGPGAYTWAVLAGIAAGGLYGAAIAMVADHAAVDERLAAMAALHAAGNAGHAVGALAAGVLLSF